LKINRKENITEKKTNQRNQEVRREPPQIPPKCCPRKDLTCCFGRGVLLFPPPRIFQIEEAMRPLHPISWKGGERKGKNPRKSLAKSNPVKNWYRPTSWKIRGNLRARNWFLGGESDWPLAI